MAERLTFEELTQFDFRWPQSGDHPFDAGAPSSTCATLEKDNFYRPYLMQEGYRKSANLLVDKAIQDWHEGTYLVYPIMFLYRHTLELNLKHIINCYGTHVGIDPNWKSHDLHLLWPLFQRVLEGFGVEDAEDTDKVVKSVIAEFSKIDPASFSYRYPCDKSGNAIPLLDGPIDLLNLKEVMEGVFNYFIGTDGYLDRLVFAVP